MSGERRAAGYVLPGVLVVFFLSGISGLVYQVVWAKMLGRVFGITTFAASAVLGAYFCGVALGGYLGGRLADRHGGLRLYGALEIALGLVALVVMPAFETLTPLYRSLYPLLQNSPPLLTTVRVLLSFAVLIVPTTLLGSALPILARTLAARSEELGQRLPRLYAWNTFGSMLGSIVTGYFLIGVVGLSASMYIAAFLNLVIGAVAMILARYAPVASHAESHPIRPPAPASPALSTLSRVALIATFCSGFASLGYEVVWMRVLSLLSDHSASTFSGIVAIVLAGIGLGSFIVPALNRRFSDPTSVLAYSQIVLTLSIALWYPALAWASSVLVVSPGESGLNTGPLFALALLLTLIPSVLMGVSFPLAVQVYSLRSPPVGAGTGRMYAVNVFGAMLGSIITGFFLIPALGAQRTLFALTILNLAAASLLFLANGQPRRARLSGGFIGLAGAVLLIAPNSFYQSIFSNLSRLEVIQVYEGLEGSTVLSRRGATLYIHTNGVHDADTQPTTLAVHRLIGYLPVFLRPDLENGLVVGLGGGATSGAVAHIVEGDIEIVELSDGMVAAARAFADHSGSVLDSAHTVLVVADARNYLLITDHQYDVITSDTIYPTQAYSSNLYSVDYFRLMARHLTDDGVAVQWIDSSLPKHEQQMLIRTFIQAFPHVALWQNYLTLVIGSKQPIVPDETFIAGRFSTQIARDLAPLGISDRNDILAGFKSSDEALRAEIGPGLIISDDHPYNEYFRLLRIGNLWTLLPDAPLIADY